ncbi:hypothetical protein EV177_010563, partial [Coemansia sp. RSA 1804]
QFVDQQVLTPIVRNAALAAATAAAASPPSVLSPSEGPANHPAFAGGVPEGPEVVVTRMSSVSLDPKEPPVDLCNGDGIRSRSDSESHSDSGGADGGAVSAQPPPPPHQDPYEDLLNEVDQLLGEIKDDDDAKPNGAAAAKGAGVGSSSSAAASSGSGGSKNPP